MQGLVVEPEFRHRAGAKIVHQHIALFCHLDGEITGRLAPQIHDDAALVPVERQKGRACAEIRHALFGDAECSCIVAMADILDLDDIGTEIAKNLGCRRTGKNPRKIENTDAL